MGYKLKRATIRVNGVEKQIRPILTPYNPDITTATQDQSVQPLSLSNNRCIDVSSDGYHILMYTVVANSNPVGVYEYTLSTPFDLTSTITQTGYTNYNTNINGDCALYSDDGNCLYINTNSTVYQYELSTPFSISTMGASPIHTKTTSARLGGFRFYDNGTKIIGAGRDSIIYTGELSTARDISTLGNLTAQTTQNQYGSYGQGFAISPDGKTCYMVSEYESNIAQVDSTTAYDFSNGTKTTRSLSGTKFGIKILNGGQYCFIGLQNGTIYRYSFQEL